MKNLFVDVWLGITDWLYVEVPAQKPAKKPVDQNNEEEFNWKGVLYHGELDAVVPHDSVQDLILSEK